MIKTVLFVVLAAIALLLIYAATRPDTFAVERSTTIAAPADGTVAELLFAPGDQVTEGAELLKIATATA